MEPCLLALKRQVATDKTVGIFIQPAILLPSAKNVTYPSTLEVAEISL